jgi:hypothetical protein
MKLKRHDGSGFMKQRTAECRKKEILSILIKGTEILYEHTNGENEKAYEPNNWL